MDGRKLTLEELITELKAHTMAIRNAINNCDELDDKYMSISFIADSENPALLHAWFNNHPEKHSNTPKVSYILGYNPEDPYKWERGV